jgi:PAS domain S-box-containing protein
MKQERALAWTQNKIRVLIIAGPESVSDWMASVISTAPDLAFMGLVRDLAAPVDHIDKLEPDVALVDISSGILEMGDLINSLSTPSVTPAVIIVAMMNEVDSVRQAMLHGAQGFLLKPFSEAALLDRIRSLLDAPIERRRADERREELVGYGGERHAIVGGGQQIMNLLLSLYENTLNQNRELTSVQTQLNLLNESLDVQVRSRTAALVESEQRLRAVFEATVDGVLVADAETGKFLIGNRAICDMLGYEPEELPRLGVRDIHPPEALPEVQRQFDEMKRQSHIARNLPVKRKDGRTFFADISGAVMRDRKSVV